MSKDFRRAVDVHQGGKGYKTSSKSTPPSHSETGKMKLKTIFTLSRSLQEQCVIVSEEPRVSSRALHID